MRVSKHTPELPTVEISICNRSDGGADYDFIHDEMAVRIFWDGGGTHTFSIQPETEGDLVEIDIPDIKIFDRANATRWIMEFVESGGFIKYIARAALLNSQGQ